MNDNIVKVNFEENGVKVTGIIGNTNIARDSRKDQIIFLNKRNIKSQILTNSADQAFKGSTGIGKYGFFILNMEMPANFYDINVHPTKMEVRFENENEIYKIFYHAIKSAILSKEFLGNSQTEDNNDEYISNEYDFLTNHFVNDEKDESKEDTKTNYFAKKAVNANESVNILDEKNELIHREKKRDVVYKYIGILFKTFIIVEIDNELYLIDQHAAHEKILYEKYSRDIENGEIVVQQLLLPCLIDLSLDDYECYNENKDIFINSGFVIEEFGGNTISLKEVPYFLGKLDAKNFLLSIIDNLKNLGSGKTVEVKLNKIATMACKAAVKANDYLTQLEMEKLISDLRYIDNPFNCPHGRPTTIFYSTYDLEKLFKRVV